MIHMKNDTTTTFRNFTSAQSFGTINPIILNYGQQTFVVHTGPRCSSTSTPITFIDVYKAYHERLINFASGLVETKEDAENIVQDVFLNLWEKKELLLQVENVSSYLYKIVRNQCIDHLKHKLLQEKYVDNMQASYERELYYKLQSADALEDAYSFNEHVEKTITEAVEALPHRCREIFIMSRYEGLKYKEISERLSLSVNTIETQMSIALKKLRGKLKLHALIE